MYKPERTLFEIKIFTEFIQRETLLFENVPGDRGALPFRQKFSEMLMNVVSGFRYGFPHFEYKLILLLIYSHLLVNVLSVS